MTAPARKRATAEELEEYPLARATGWSAARRTTGGILFLYPPRDRQHAKDGQGGVSMSEGIEAVHPDDYHKDVGPALTKAYRKENPSRGGRGTQALVRYTKGTVWIGRNFVRAPCDPCPPGECVPDESDNQRCRYCGFPWPSIST